MYYKSSANPALRYPFREGCTFRYFYTSHRLCNLQIEPLRGLIERFNSAFKPAIIEQQAFSIILQEEYLAKLPLQILVQSNQKSYSLQCLCNNSLRHLLAERRQDGLRTSSSLQFSRT